MSEQMVAVTVGTWQEEWGTWLARKGANEKTRKAYVIGMGQFAGWFEQATGFEFKPDLLNSFDLVRYRQWVLEVARKENGEPYAPSTWNQRLAALRKFCRWAGLDVKLPENLFEDVKKAEVQELPPDWLTDAEFGRLGSWLHSTAFDAYDHTERRQWQVTRNRALVVVMLYAGLREMEAANLELCDVTLSERKGLLVVRRGKGGKKRSIPVGDAQARAVLRRWLAVRGEEGTFFFTDDQGGRLSERTIQDICKEVGARCKVADLRPHRLRHTCGKRMVDAGVGLEKAGKILGHANLNVTRRYVEPGREDLEEATAAVALGRMARTTYMR